MKAYVKLFFEVTPLIVFFLVNSYYGIYQATLYFMIASIIAVPVACLVAGFVVVFGLPLIVEVVVGVVGLVVSPLVWVWGVVCQQLSVERVSRVVRLVNR